MHVDRRRPSVYDGEARARVVLSQPNDVLMFVTPRPASTLASRLLTALVLTVAALSGSAALAQTCPAPATEWANPVNGNWGDAANWTAGVPNAGLNACIIASGTYTVTLNVAGNARSLVLGRTTGGATQTLLNTGQTLSLGNPSTINARGVYDWRGGNTGGASTLTNSGLLAISGAALKDIAGSTTIRNQALTTLDGTGNLRFFGSGSRFENASGATFDVQSDADFTIFNGGNAFDNDGLFQKSGGTDVSLVSRSGLDFDNAGTVDAQAGTIQFDGNGAHDGGVFAADASAEVFFNAGTHTIVGTISGTPEGVVRLDADATLAGGTVDFGGSGFEWQGGNFGTVTNVGLLKLTTGGQKDLNGGSTLTNESLVEMSDTGLLRFFGSGSVFVNASGATFDLRSDASFTISNGGNTFTNNGTFQKTGGTDVSQVSRNGLDFDNNQTVRAESGTIQLSGAGTHTNSTFTADAGAAVFFDAGVHTIVGTISGTPEGVVRMDTGATLVDDGSGATLAFGGSGFEWQSGNVGGDVTNTNLLKLTTSGLKDLNGGSTLTNESLVEMSDTGLLRFFGSGSRFENASGATFDVQSDADFTIFNGGNAFDNDGLFQKSGGTDVSLVSRSGLDFDNAGTVDAQAGTIQFDGNGAHDGGVFAADASAEVFFNAGTHTIVGTISGTPEGVVRLDADATLAGGTVDFGGSGFEWQGGNFGTVTNVGLLKLTTGGQKDLNGGSTLTNESLVEMSDTGLLRFFGSGSVFVNASGATFDLRSDASFTIFNGGNSVSNSGLFQKTGGTGSSQVSRGGLDFTNNAGGVVSAESGTLDADGVFVHADGALIQGTATFDRAGAALTQNGDTGPGVNPGPGVLAWTGAFVPQSTSVFNVEVAGNDGAGVGHDQLQVTGAATLSGTLDASLLDGFRPEEDNEYVVLTATGGVNGTFSNPNGRVFAGNGVAFTIVYQPNQVLLVADLLESDLVVSKTVDGAASTAVDVGAQVTFVVTVQNTGPDDLSEFGIDENVVVTDNLPAGLTLVSATESAGTYDAGTGEWTIPSLPSGASEALTLVATVDQAGTFTNTAAITSSDLADTDDSNNSASATVEGQAADLRVEKAAPLATVEVGDSFTYVVTLTNDGPTDATDIVIDDEVPAGLSCTAVTSNGAYSAANGEWTVPTLANDASETLTFSCTAAATGSYTNTATRSESSPVDLNADNDSDAATVAVMAPGEADLALAKVVDEDEPTVGDQVTFTVTLTNNGPEDAADITVSDPEPDGLTFGSVTSETGGSYDAGVWTVAALASGGSIDLTIVATVTRTGTSTNTATVTASSRPDSNTDNNTASATVDGQSDVVVQDCTTASPLYISAFSAGSPGQVTVQNDSGTETVDLPGCTLAIYDGFDETVEDTAVAPTPLAPSAPYDYSVDIEVGRPGAAVVSTADLSNGSTVSDAAGTVVAAVVFDATGAVYEAEDGTRGECGNGGGLRSCSSAEGRAALARAFAALFGNATASEGDGALALGVSVGPNPVRSSARVTYGVVESADVRVSVYDALGREVAVLASGPKGAGMHDAAFDGASLPAGVYVVRAVVGAEARTATVTVAR